MNQAKHVLHQGPKTIRRTDFPDNVCCGAYNPATCKCNQPLITEIFANPGKYPYPHPVGPLLVPKPATDTDRNTVSKIFSSSEDASGTERGEDMPSINPAAVPPTANVFAASHLIATNEAERSEWKIIDLAGLLCLNLRAVYEHKHF